MSEDRQGLIWSGSQGWYSTAYKYWAYCLPSWTMVRLIIRLALPFPLHHLQASSTRFQAQLLTIASQNLARMTWRADKTARLTSLTSRIDGARFILWAPDIQVHGWTPMLAHVLFVHFHCCGMYWAWRLRASLQYKDVIVRMHICRLCPDYITLLILYIQSDTASLKFSLLYGVQTSIAKVKEPHPQTTKPSSKARWNNKTTDLIDQPKLKRNNTTRVVTQRLDSFWFESIKTCEHWAHAMSFFFLSFFSSLPPLIGLYNLYRLLHLSQDERLKN